MTGHQHIYTFDGNEVSFQGACNYVMARDNCKDGTQSKAAKWSIEVNYEKLGTRLFYIDQVNIRLHSLNKVWPGFQHAKWGIWTSLLGLPALTKYASSLKSHKAELNEITSMLI